MKLRILPFLLSLILETTAFTQGMPLEEWLRVQLGPQNLDGISILDAKIWPNAPQPNTYIILGIGCRGLPAERKNAEPYGPCLAYSQERHKIFLLLAQSASANDLVRPKQLALSVLQEATGSSRKENRPASIDIGPFQIRRNEYAFGIRDIQSSLGNKGGAAYEILDLFRYRTGEVKEIFSDVTWAYDKGTGCNIEATVSAAENGEYFTLRRQYLRSYLGHERNPQYQNGDPPYIAGNFTNIISETPKPSDEKLIDGCSSDEPFIGLRTPNTSRWNSAQDRYVDSSGKLLGYDNSGGLVIHSDK